MHRPLEASFAELLIEHVLDIITVLDVKGTILYESPSLERVLGYPQDALNGRSAFSLIHPLDVPRVMPVFMLALATPGVPHSIRFRFKHSNGSWRHLEAVGKCVHMPDGMRVIVTSRDVTDGSKAEAALGESEARFRNVVEGLGEGLLITNNESVILYANGRLASMIGCDVHEILGKIGYEVLLPKEKWPKVPEWRHDQQHLGRPNQYETEILRKDGSMLWTEVITTPYITSEGEHLGTIAAFTDISDRKRAEQELERTYAKLEEHSFSLQEANRQLERGIAGHREAEILLRAAKDKAEEMNRLKSAFLANMSHEIRTPMTSILGFAAILAEQTKGSELHDYADTIERSGRRLLETINGLLDLARIEANKVDLHVSEISVGTELSKIVKLLSPLAAQKNIDLQLQLPSQELITRLDSYYFERVCMNIVGNAIKFTERGFVRVEASADKDGSRYCVRITDTGIGIASGFLPHIFEEFKQESSGWTRHYEGSGLGLTLAKRYIDMMGGTVTVQSIQGVGSCFTLIFPMTQEALEASSAIIAPQHRQRVAASSLPRKNNAIPSVLLVEDNRDTARLITRVLRDAAVVTHVLDVPAAVAALEEQQFDAAVIDINLGTGKTGLNLTRIIRENQQLRELPVIVVTAYAMEGDREQALASGCSDYLSKPFTKDELVAVLSRHIPALSGMTQAA